MTVITWLFIVVQIGWVIGECPPGWEHRWNKCYLFSSTPHNWNDASASCRSHHANLAEVESRDEDEYFRSYAQKTKHSYYIGLSDQNVEGKWEWLSGLYVEYSNWAPGEPDNIFDQDCCLYNNLFKFQWTSGSCWIGLHYICEMHYPGTDEVVG